MRQLTNQYLLAPSDKITVARDLLGVQAQFMQNALHSLKTRCDDFDEAAAGEGLVKNWTIRGTMHVFAQEDLPLFLPGGDRANYRRNEWYGKSFWNQRQSWSLTPLRQKELADMILQALEEGPRTREELKSVCREKGMTQQEESCMFDSWGGGIRELCERGFINYVVQEKKAYCLSPEFSPLPREEAELEMARRYFTNIAPATIHDAMYFFHTSAGKVKEWLSHLPVTALECAGKTWYYIENGKSFSHGLEGCLFLAGFDQLMLGYEKRESLYLRPDDLRAVFNLAGIVAPTILLDGQVTGRWKKKSRKVEVEAFRGLGRREKTLIRKKARELWGETTVVEGV